MNNRRKVWRYCILGTFALWSIIAHADSWMQLAAPVSTDLMGVRIVDDTLGYAVGEKGTILKTGDGGKTWIRQTSGLDAQAVLTSVACQVPGNVVAVGNRWNVVGMVTPDNAWQLNGVPDRDWKAICNVTASNFVFVGSGGGIVLDSTTPGGGFRSNGTQRAFLSSPTTLPLFGVSFLTPTDGIAVGDSGMILVTQNGGSSWDIHQSPHRSPLRSVATGNTSEACAVGDNGTILITTDRGATWLDASPAGLFTNLHSVAYSNASTVVAVGDTGVIIKSTDGGRTWTQQSVNTFADLRSVSCWEFAGSTIWVAVGDGGTIVRATYGGSTGTFTKSATALDFGDVRVNASKSDTIRLTNTSSVGYLAVEAVPTDSTFAATPSAIMIPPADSGFIVITYAPHDTLLAGGWIVLKNNARWIPDSVAVEGHGVAAIGLLTADTINFMSGKKGSSDAVYLRSMGNIALRASVVSISDSNFSVVCDSTALPGDSILIRATLLHDLFLAARCRVVLKTNDYRKQFDTLALSASPVSGVGSRVGETAPFYSCYPNPIDLSIDRRVFLRLPDDMRDALRVVLADAAGHIWLNDDSHSESLREEGISLSASGIPTGTYTLFIGARSRSVRMQLVVVK